MKKVLNDRIINLDENLFDNKFLFPYLNTDYKSNDIEVFYMSELLKNRENKELLNTLGDKYAMYSNVYSEKDELDIFNELFNYAISNNKKIHIVGITLKEEIEILEEYYTNLGFKREDVNCFIVDFSIPLVTVSINIENLIWKGSDYKKMKSEIFFLPPVREAGQTKAMFKGINKGIVTSINVKRFDQKVIDFFKECLTGEHILSLTLSKVLYYNSVNRGFSGEEIDFEINY